MLNMSRLFALAGKDICNGFRNQIILYMFFSPIIMILAFQMVIPLLEGTTVQFVVDPSVPTDFEDRLRRTSQVERVSSYEELTDWVNQSSGWIGVFRKDASYALVFYGTEEEEIRQAAVQMAMIAATDLNDAVPVTVHSMGVEQSQLYTFLTAVLILLIGMWAGISMGLTVVDDKESGMIRAQAVCPITIGHYWASKILIVVAYNLLYGVIVSLAMVGTSLPGERVLMIVLASSALGVFMGMIIGVFADNQNTAIAIIKVSAFLLGFVPLLSMFFDSNWEWVFYPIPSFWVFRSVSGIVSGTGAYGWHFVLAILTNIGAFVLMMPLMIKKLRLRIH